MYSPLSIYLFLKSLELSLTTVIYQKKLYIKKDKFNPNNKKELISYIKTLLKRIINVQLLKLSKPVSFTLHKEKIYVCTTTYSRHVQTGSEGVSGIPDLLFDKPYILLF